MPEELFDGIDLSLPDEQLAEWLEHVLNQRGQPGSDGETEALQKLSCQAGPKTRGVAVQFLAEHGPCFWEDLEKWALDADQQVRYPIVCVRLRPGQGTA